MQGLQKEWIMALPPRAIEMYDHKKFGPILGVSDEGSASQTIADAAYASAKAHSVERPDAMVVGVIVDGERMGSAGELPVGPPEYAQFYPAAKDRVFTTTNVGVRVNTRLQQAYPEFHVSDAAQDIGSWLDKIFLTFYPFIHTPDGNPRPLTVRLTTKNDACLDALRGLVPKIEAGRTGCQDAKLGPRELHRLSLLVEFDNEINGHSLQEIRKLMTLASELGVPEVAINARLHEGARRRISVQGLLNVVDETTATTLLGEAESLGISLVYNFEVDQETAVRTVWTGLNSAHHEGLTAAKYGLFPLKLSQQKHVVERIQEWMAEAWTPIPAFYADTALVTDNEVYGKDKVVEGCKVWLRMIAEVGARVVLIDTPDRVIKHRLLKTGGNKDEIGVMTLEQVSQLVEYSDNLGIKALWSGGIKPDQAFQLGRLGVAGIFTTGSTAHAVAVHETMSSDAQLAHQTEPTAVGVRRIHTLLQAGYLCRVLAIADPILVEKLNTQANDLVKSGIGDEAKPVIASLNKTLVAAWKMHWDNQES